jgi:hypothetical protein
MVQLDRGETAQISSNRGSSRLQSGKDAHESCGVMSFPSIFA